MGAQVDENNDGKISFEEFSNAMIDDLESTVNGADKIPFVNIYHNAFFQILPEKENDPLFENEADYIEEEEEEVENEEQNEKVDKAEGQAIVLDVDSEQDGDETTTVPMTEN